jgi:hypothetical protein
VPKVRCQYDGDALGNGSQGVSKTHPHQAVISPKMSLRPTEKLDFRGWNLLQNLITDPYGRETATSWCKGDVLWVWRLFKGCGNIIRQTHGESEQLLAWLASQPPTSLFIPSPFYAHRLNRNDVLFFFSTWLRWIDSNPRWVGSYSEHCLFSSCPQPGTMILKKPPWQSCKVS